MKYIPNKVAGVLVGVMVASGQFMIPPAISYVSGSSQQEKPVIKHQTIIDKLIECETQGINISRKDSNGRISDGILQFNRGPSNKMGSGTWADMSQKSGIQGSPIIPQDAVKMASWMIDNGYGARWTCWRLLGLKKTI